MVLSFFISDELMYFLKSKILFLFEKLLVFGLKFFMKFLLFGLNFMLFMLSGVGVIIFMLKVI